MEPGWLDEIEPATSPPFVRMGTRALGGGAWLLGGPDVPAQLAEKRRVLAAQHDAVVAALDGTEPAAAELLDLVHHHRATLPPDLLGPPIPPGATGDPAHPQGPADAPPDAPPGTDRRPHHRPAPATPGTDSPAAADRHDAAPRPDMVGRPHPAAGRGSARPSSGGTGQVDPAAEPEPEGLHPPATRPAPVPPVGPDPSGSTAGGLHPIDAAGRLVAEDLCLLVPRHAGWVLGAGSVCFPSHWRLPEKLGLPLAAVHAPVPDYATELADRVDRFLAKLRAGRGVVRRNWTIHTEPDLFAPDRPPAPDPPIGPGEAGHRLWLRSERQTLTRLPRTGAIVFTIRTQQVGLAAVATHPGLRARLARAVAAWPPHQVAYRGGEATRGPLLAWLRLALR